MKEAILNFPNQFKFNPEVLNSQALKGDYQQYVLAGMGGSHLAGGIFQMLYPEVDLQIHRDYGLPVNFSHSSDYSKTLFIASSYSGNTEEVLDFADEAYSRGLDVCIITTGGALLEFATKNNLAHIVMPSEGIQPRTALGYSLLSLAKIISPNQIESLQKMGQNLNVEQNLRQAKDLALSLKGRIPVIYTSSQNRPIAYNWKIKMNETGKIPAFYNSLPELNHNEMQGYDFNELNQDLSENFSFIFIQDENDHVRIIDRFKALEKIYQKKNLPVISLFLSGETKFQKIFQSLLLADWVALELAGFYNSEPEQVPLIEEFKMLL